MNRREKILALVVAVSMCAYLGYQGAAKLFLDPKAELEKKAKTLRTDILNLEAENGLEEVYLAALRPKMLELAGELADGVVMHLAPMSLLPGMLASVAAGAKRSGRELSSLDIACRFNVVMAKNKAEAMEPAREFIQRYFTAPIYRRFFEWCGFEAEAEAFEKGFREKDRAATRAAITDRVVETFCIIGAPEECREQVAAFHAAGITSPAINACTTDGEVAQRIFEAFLPEHF